MRLIDADKLKEAIEQGEGFSWDSYGKDDLCVRKKYIDNAPTVPLPDFKEGYKQAILDGQTNFKRQRGEWLKSDIPESVLAKCSICGFDCGAYTYNFCPNCGAKMKGDDDE